MDTLIEINAVCFSEKAEGSLGFGFSISETDYNNARISDAEELYIGISDSYWENWSEFEPGVLEAKKMVDEGLYSKAKEALFEVFGHFELYFEIDEVEKHFDYEFDTDELMYTLLEGTYLYE